MSTDPNPPVPVSKLLLVAPNWLGDGIMLMPALQLLRQLQPELRIDLLCKASQLGLWSMHPALDAVHLIPKSMKTWPELAKAFRGHERAVIIPNSFRSALLPRLAGIPIRRGTADQFGRGLLINEAVDLSPFGQRHQQWENAELLLEELPENLPPPDLHPPEAALDKAAAWLEALPKPWLACIPAAARGPSKEWPESRFLEASKRWRSETGGSVLWLGGPPDRERCLALEAESPERAISLAGQSSLSEFAALLKLADRVLANDSGGMHVAAAVGTPPVAIYGLTDPDKTGPLHPQAQLLQAPGKRSREIPRESAEAVAALEKIQVDEVIQALLK